MNLTTNAGHAMQENGGVLEVTLANVELDALSAEKHLDLDAGSYLRLTVSDTGHGMTPETMERIFDPYFTTKDTGEGTGLGLSVAHGIVKAHGGAITVYSELGKGTTFHVYLPVIHEAEKAEKDEPKEALPTGSERILFIDDEEVLLEIGGQMLELLGYEVVTKISSEQALEMFRKQPDQFDLVITDMTMPHMTGDKFARELMKIRPHISVILCTGHSTLVLEEKAKDIGIRAFVMKPLVMRNLAETVRKVLDEK
jgi:CheY-like chemotaxis protein